MGKTLEVSDETYDKIKDQLATNEQIKEYKNYQDLLGKKFLFRTVTYHQVGRVVGFMGNFMILENASWVADSGRFEQAIKEGKLAEVEPVGDCFVNMNSIVDFFPWNHKLPVEQK